MYTYTHTYINSVFRFTYPKWLSKVHLTLCIFLSGEPFAEFVAFPPPQYYSSIKTSSSQQARVHRPDKADIVFHWISYVDFHVSLLLRSSILHEFQYDRRRRNNVGYIYRIRAYILILLRSDTIEYCYILCFIWSIFYGCYEINRKYIKTRKLSIDFWNFTFTYYTPQYA